MRALQQAPHVVGRRILSPTRKSDCPYVQSRIPHPSELVIEHIDPRLASTLHHAAHSIDARERTGGLHRWEGFRPTGSRTIDIVHELRIPCCQSPRHERRKRNGVRARAEAVPTRHKDVLRRSVAGSPAGQPGKERSARRWHVRGMSVWFGSRGGVPRGLVV